MNRILYFFLSIGLMFFSHLGNAHIASKAYLTIKWLDGNADTTIKIASGDIGYALGLDADLNGELTLAEFKSASRAITHYLETRVVLLGSDGAFCTHTPYRFKIEQVDEKAYLFAGVNYKCSSDHAPRLVYTALFDTTVNHTVLVNITLANLTHAQARHDFVITQADAGKTISLAEQNVISGLISYVLTGIWHILIGYDHILFIIALLVPAVLVRTRAEREGPVTLSNTVCHIAVIVTAFTLAHSTTLFLAVSGWVHLNETVIEMLIAFSIAVAGLGIVMPPGRGRHWLIAFCFGLIHGFGFAGILQTMLIDSSHLVRDLLAFNVGVEIGQLVIILLVVPVLFIARNRRWYQRYLLPASSVAVTLFGLALTVVRSPLY